MRRDLAAALRVSAVAALLLLAALGTAGRRGLSWRALLGTPSDPLAGTALLVVGALVVGGVVRAVVTAWRRRRRRRRGPAGPPDDRYPEEIPVGRRVVLSAVAAAVVLAGLVAVLAGLWVSRENGRLHAVAETTSGARGAHATMSPAFAAMLAAAAALLALAFVLSSLARRSARGLAAAPRRQAGETAAADAAVADAAAAASHTLARYDDVRQGVIAAYEAMVAVLAARGAERAPADTAEDLLALALRASSAPPAAARDLTRLFHEARFSSHPMGAPARARAEGALRAVVASTGTERVPAHG